MGPEVPCNAELFWRAHKKQQQCCNNQLKISRKMILEGSWEAWQLYKTKAIMWSTGGAGEKELWGRTRSTLLLQSTVKACTDIPMIDKLVIDMQQTEDSTLTTSLFLPLILLTGLTLSGFNVVTPHFN